MIDNCAIYVRPGNVHDKGAEWGGVHITMAGFQNINRHTALHRVAQIAQNHFANGNKWKPLKKDYSLEKWKGRWTMIIKSATLRNITHCLNQAGFVKLKGPTYCGQDFHVTFPEHIKTFGQAKDLAANFANRKWYLTVAIKTGEKRCDWLNHPISLKR